MLKKIEAGLPKPSVRGANMALRVGRSCHAVHSLGGPVRFGREPNVPGAVAGLVRGRGMTVMERKSGSRGLWFSISDIQ